MREEVNRTFRRLTRAAIGFLAVGGLLFTFGLALPSSITPLFLAISLVMLIGAFVLWAPGLVRRLWYFILQRPVPDGSTSAPQAYKCHACGYELRGVEGPFCPECGTVRPAPLDDQEHVWSHGPSASPLSRRGA